MSNATVFVALAALLLGYSIFVVVPAALLILWLLLRGHGPVRSTARTSRMGRLLESRVTQALAVAVLVGAELIRSGVLRAVALAVLLLFCIWFVERYLYLPAPAPD